MDDGQKDGRRKSFFASAHRNSGKEKREEINAAYLRDDEREANG